MMNFRTIKAALLDLFETEASGRYVVIGHQRQTKSADSVNKNKLLRVYYSRGEFPKGSSGYTGPKKHNQSFNIELTVSVSAKADLATLENENSTPAEIQAALAGVKSAAGEADRIIDEFIEIVFQIALDARNLDLGLPVGMVTSRWIENIEKDTTIEQGGFAVKTANMTYSCSTSEAVPGNNTQVPIKPIIDNTFGLDGDDVSKTGVTVNNS